MIYRVLTLAAMLESNRDSVESISVVSEVVMAVIIESEKSVVFETLLNSSRYIITVTPWERQRKLAREYNLESCTQ